MVFKNKTLPFHMLNMYCNKILHNKPFCSIRFCVILILKTLNFNFYANLY